MEAANTHNAILEGHHRTETNRFPVKVHLGQELKLIVLLNYSAPPLAHHPDWHCVYCFAKSSQKTNKKHNLIASNFSVNHQML